MSGLLAAVAYNPASTTSFTTTQTQLADPAHVQLDATNLVVTFTTGSSGKIRVVLSVYILASSTNADNFLEFSLVDNTSTVVVNTVASDHGGRRVNLQDSVAHRAKLDLEYTLTANTAYTLYWGVANGSQNGNASTVTYTIKYGGGKGPATMEIWDLTPTVTYTQTIAVTGTSSVNVARAVTLSPITVAGSGAVSVIRQAALHLAAAGTSNATVGRVVAKTVTAASTSSVAVQRLISKTVTVSVAAASSVRRTISKTVKTTVTSSVNVIVAAISGVVRAFKVIGPRIKWIIKGPQT